MGKDNGNGNGKRPDPEVLSAERDGDTVVVTVGWKVVVPVDDLQQDTDGRRRPRPKADRLKVITGRLDAGEVRR